MSTIKWQQTCCVWHGEYAEAKTKDGGVARIKRSSMSDHWLVMLFNAKGQPANRAEDGSPAYAAMSPATAQELLA